MLNLTPTDLQAIWLSVKVATTATLITLPLGFARSLGEFGATIILAGNIPGITQTIPLNIYDYTKYLRLHQLSRRGSRSTIPLPGVDCHFLSGSHSQ